MADEKPYQRLRNPALASATSASMPSLAADAGVMWRLWVQGKERPVLESGNASDEYKSVSEFMRLYATLRFYQLALLLGTTGSIVTALASPAVRASFMRAEFLKCGALLVTMALLVMEFRSSTQWHHLRTRANELAQVLRFQPFAASSRWSPFTTSGAGFYLHACIALLWVASLLLKL